MIKLSYGVLPHILISISLMNYEFNHLKIIKFSLINIISLLIKLFIKILMLTHIIFFIDIINLNYFSNWLFQGYCFTQKIITTSKKILKNEKNIIYF